MGCAPIASSVGQADLFVTKLGPSGNCIYSKAAGDADYQHGQSIAVNGAGNVLLTGYFGGTLDLGCGPLSSAGAFDIYVARLGASGSCVWSRSAGSLDYDLSQDVAADASGHALITGTYTGFFDLGCGALPSSSSFDMFVAKLGP